MLPRSGPKYAVASSPGSVPGTTAPRSGLAFPETEYPNYWDFIYFSFVVGMTFQVSDVQVTSTALRRVVAAHGVLSFFYSVSILALAVNLGANML